MNKLRRILAVTKAELLMGSSKSAGKKDTLLKKIIKPLGILLVLAYLAFIGYSLTRGIIEALNEANMGHVFVHLVFFLAFSVITFLGLKEFSYGNTRVNSERHLDTLPITSRERFFGKLVAEVYYAYMLYGAILLIPLIYNGIIGSQDVFYYIKAFIGALFIPILPVTIIVTLSLVISSILKIFLGKKGIEFFSSIIGIILVVVYIKAVNTLDMSNAVTSLTSWLESSTAGKVLGYVPSLAANFVNGEDALISFLKLSGISILVIGFMVFTYGTIYVKQKIITRESKANPILSMFGSKNTDDSNNTNKENSSKDKISKTFNSGFERKSKYISYIKRDIRFFAQNPTVIINTLLIPIILPVIFGFSMYYGLSKAINEFKENPVISVTYSYPQLDVLSGYRENAEDISLKEVSLKVDRLSDEDSEIKELNEKIESIKQRVEKGEFKGEELKTANAVLNINEKHPDNIIFSLDIRDKSKAEAEKMFKEKLDQKLGELENIASISNDSKQELFKEAKKLYIDLYYADSSLETMKKSFEDLRMSMNIENNNIKIIVPMIIILALFILSTLSSYMISKEKDDIKMLKIIPIRGRDQVLLKLVPDIMLNSAIGLIYIGIVDYMLGLGIFTTPYGYVGILLGILLGTVLSAITLTLDLIFPNMNWTNTQKLIKGNFFTSVVQISKYLILFLVFPIGIVGLGLETFIYVLSAVLILAAALIFIFLNKYADMLLNRIES